MPLDLSAFAPVDEAPATREPAASPITEELLDALSKAESSDRDDAIATPDQGARGRFQLGRQEVASRGIDPKDPKQAREAARDILTKNYARFGNLDDALMAYHAGADGMAKHLAGEPQSVSGVGPKTKAYPGRVKGFLNASAPAPGSLDLSGFAPAEEGSLDVSSFEPLDVSGFEPAADDVPAPGRQPEVAEMALAAGKGPSADQPPPGEASPASPSGAWASLKRYLDPNAPPPTDTPYGAAPEPEPLDPASTELGKGLLAGGKGAQQMGVAALTVPVIGAVKTHLGQLDAFNAVDAGQAPPAEDSFVANRARMYAAATPEVKGQLRARAEAQMAGSQEFKEGLLTAWKGFEQEIQATQGRVPNFTDIRDLNDFKDYFQFTVGQTFPYMAATVLGGLLAGMPGVIATSYLMGVGDTEGDLIKAGLEEEGHRALVGAIPYAALDFLGPVGRAFRGVPAATLKHVAEGWAKRAGKEIGANVVEEFINEAGQDIVKDVATKAGTGEPIVTAEALLQWFNSGMGGAVSALLPGAGHAARQAIDPAAREPASEKAAAPAAGLDYKGFEPVGPQGAGTETQVDGISPPAEESAAVSDEAGAKAPPTLGGEPPPAPAQRSVQEINDDLDMFRQALAEPEVSDTEKKILERAIQEGEAEKAGLSEEPSTSTTFQTAKGSTYQVHDDGTTTRDKAFRPEHGEAEQGPQPRSEATIYVDREGADALGLFQATDPNGSSMVVAPLGDGRWGVRYVDGPSAGKFARTSVVTPSTEPAKGLLPVEVWDGGRRVHFGNEITKVTEPGTRSAPIKVETAEDIERASQVVNTEPTEAKKESGAYAKGHVVVQGLPISIETPKGAERTGIGADGKPWSNPSPAAYGYIKRTTGTDKEQVDVYLGPEPTSPEVYIVNQVDPKTGRLDEHKAVIGATSEAEARAIYDAGFSDKSGPDRRHSIATMSMEEFKGWLKQPGTERRFARTPKGEKAGASLAQELAARGGVQDEGDLGDLGRVRVSVGGIQVESGKGYKRVLKGILPIRRKDGMSWARAADVAHQLGYIDSADDVQALRDALSKDLEAHNRGSTGRLDRVFSRDDTGAVAERERVHAENERLRAADQQRGHLEHIAEQVGIDHRQHPTNTGLEEAIEARSREIDEAEAAMHEAVEAIKQEIDDAEGRPEFDIPYGDIADPRAEGAADQGEVRPDAVAEGERPVDDGHPEERGAGEEAAGAEPAEAAGALDETDQGKQRVIPGAEKKTAAEVKDAKAEAAEKKRADEERVEKAQSKLRKGNQKEADTQKGGLFEAKTDTLLQAEDEKAAADEAADPVSPEFRSRAAQVQEQLERIAKKLFPGLRIEITEKPTIETVGGRATPAYGTYSVEGLARIASIPLRNSRGVLRSARQLVMSLGHEGVHYLKEMGVISPKDALVLERAVKAQGWKSRFNIDSRYRGLTEDEKAEEAIADAFGAYQSGQLQVPSGIRAIFDRVGRLLEAFGNWLRGNGFRSYRDVFRDVSSGALLLKKLPATMRQAIAANEKRLQQHLDSITPKPASFGAALDKAQKGMDRQVKKLMVPTGDIEGGEQGPDRLAPDLGMFTSIFIDPRMIASLKPEFTPVYMTAEHQQQIRDGLVFKYRNIGQRYFDMAPEKRKKVDAALELGALQYEVFGGDNIKMTNRGEHDAGHAALSKPGDVIHLDQEQSRAYGAMRRMYDTALDDFRDQILRENGFDPSKPNQPKTSSELLRRALAATKAGNLDQAAQFRFAAKMVEEIEDAKSWGYVPFSRYGNVAIIVQKKVPTVGIGMDGKKAFDWETVERRHFEIDGMLDKLKEKVGRATPFKDIPQIKDAMEELRAKYKDDPNVRIGDPHLMAPRNLETDIKLGDIDVLAEAAKIDDNQWEPIREKIAHAIKSRTFKAHFFKRRQIAGYSTDFERTGADYIIGMSNYMARRQTREAWDKALGDIPATMPRLRKYAKDYHDYFQNPTEEMAALRQLSFLWAIGPRISALLVNGTQPIVTSIPHLAKFVPVHIAAKEQARASAQALGMLRADAAQLKEGNPFDFTKAPADVRSELLEMERDGQFLPVYTHEMLALAHNRSKRGSSEGITVPGIGHNSGVGQAISKATSQKTRQSAVQWAGAPFGMVERINRVTTAMAAIRIAKRIGNERIQKIVANDPLAVAKLKDGSPLSFAEWSVDETQFRLGKVNRARVGRGAGSPFMILRGFTANMFERQYKLAKLYGKEGKAEILLMALGIFLFAGIQGQAGADNIEDLLDWTMKKITGEDFDTRRLIREGLFKLTGSAKVAEALDQGLTRFLGVDTTKRVGIGSIPGVEILVHALTSKDMTVPLGDLSAPLGMTIGAVKEAQQKLEENKPLAAVGAALPYVLKDLIASNDWADDYTGGVRSARTGITNIPAEMLSKWDIIQRAIGFTPGKVANTREAEYAKSREGQAVTELQADYARKLARAIVAQERAEDKKDLGAYARFQKQEKAVWDEIEAHNKKAPDSRQVVVDPSKSSFQTLLNRERVGYEAVKGQVKTRGERTRIGDIYGVGVE